MICLFDTLGLFSRVFPEELRSEVGAILRDVKHTLFHVGPEDASRLHLGCLLGPRVKIVVKAAILAQYT